jgi:hypothetical protein
MKLHFYIDSDDEAERCRKSFQGHTPVVVSGLDTLTGRINSYSGVVLAVDESVQSLGEHWRITMETGDAPARRPLSTLLSGSGATRQLGLAAPNR